MGRMSFYKVWVWNLTDIEMWKFSHVSRFFINCLSMQFIVIFNVWKLQQHILHVFILYDKVEFSLIWYVQRRRWYNHLICVFPGSYIMPALCLLKIVGNRASLQVIMNLLCSIFHALSYIEVHFRHSNFCIRMLHTTFNFYVYCCFFPVWETHEWRR